MTRVAFPDLPIAVRVSVFLSFFMAWVMVAEFIIDRHGLDRFHPFYRVGNLCLYDLVVVTLLVALWWRLHRARPAERS